MQAPMGTVPAGRHGWSHGLLYCVASLVLGIELNIVGPTVSSLAAQVGVAESALGGVVGLGGIGLLVGGIPSGWLLDKLPGHAVLSGAAALQAITFCLLPHCEHLAILAATYCAAALTFNAITTGANSLILWRYPSTQAAWLNLASALFGVGCFLAPVLADLSSSGQGGQQPGRGASGGRGEAGAAEAADGGRGGGGGPPFSLRGGAAALAYYLVAAGAAGCAVWALLLPSPARPEPHVHHEHGLEQQQQRRPYAGQRREGGSKLLPVGGSNCGGSSSNSLVLQRSPSFASVLDMGGLQSSATDSSPASAGDSNLQKQHHPYPKLTVVEGCSHEIGAVATAEAASATPSNTAPATAGGSGSMVSKPSSTSVSYPSGVNTVVTASNDGGSGTSGGATEGCFGSALSSSSPAAMEPAAAGGPRSNPLYGTYAPGDAADVLSAAATQIKLMQLQRQHERGHHQAAAVEQGWMRAGGGGGDEVAAAAGGPDAAMASSLTGCHSPLRESALFSRYLHELRMGWPVLLPVVLLLFANISTQASFGAWVTTYCRRAVGLDEPSAQAVTAAYWAAFTGTRLAGVVVAPFLHASNVLLVTSPFAVVGSALAVLGLPHIPGLNTHAAAGRAFAADLPTWALYTAVCLVGVGIATGFANTVSLTGDHLRLDGFTNGILSSVAGLASTLCPAAVPWLAEHMCMGYGALMSVGLVMSGVQLAMVVAALVGARWVDEWQRREEEELQQEEEILLREREGSDGEVACGVAAVVVVVPGAAEEEGQQEEEKGRARGGRFRRGRAVGGGGDLGAPLLKARSEERLS